MFFNKFYKTICSALSLFILLSSLAVSANLATNFALAQDAAQPSASSSSANFTRRFELKDAANIQIKNPRGRITVTMNGDDESGAMLEAGSFSDAPFDEKDLAINSANNNLTIEIDEPRDASANDFSNQGRAANTSRIDINLRVPKRSRIELETTSGAVDVTGDFASVEVRTTTGTISADVPLEDLRYDFQWTASRPRLYSAVDFDEPRERAAGRFEIKGRLGEKAKKHKKKSNPNDKQIDSRDDVELNETSSTPNGTNDASSNESRPNEPHAESANEDSSSDAKDKNKLKKESRTVRLNLTTERGVVIFGVDPASVPVDLHERQLTEAARVILRTGNAELIERVRRIAPKLVDEYAGTLVAYKGNAPVLTNARRTVTGETSERTMRLTASVTDERGRALRNLTADDFTITEAGAERVITNVVAGDAPFNLVLLLDVSGSVEERLEFIRRAALAFVSTIRPQDRVAIVIFRDDVQIISNFTTDHSALRTRINTIRAGGATALYDALAYTLLETLRPFQNKPDERTAVVVLSDGDDNRSFLSFNDVNRIVRETGVSVYPLYIPSGLIPANATSFTTANSSAPDIDPTRNRYLTLTTRAAEEGRQLAQATGGFFYPISRLSDLQTAYDEVVAQLRNSYTITYTSNARASSRARLQVRNQATAQVRAGQPVAVTP